jgi:hypothetical protein
MVATFYANCDVQNLLADCARRKQKKLCSYPLSGRGMPHAPPFEFHSVLDATKHYKKHASMAQSAEHISEVSLGALFPPCVLECGNLAQGAIFGQCRVRSVEPSSLCRDDGLAELASLRFATPLIANFLGLEDNACRGIFALAQAALMALMAARPVKWPSRTSRPLHT